MTGCSVAAKQYVLSAKKTGKTTEELVNDLKNIPKVSTAGEMALKGLSMAGNMLVGLLISKGIEWAVQAIDNYVHKLEYAKEALAETNSKIDETNSQLKKNKARIDEINNLESPTLVEQNELNKLEEENRLLEINLDLLRKKQAKESATVAKETKKDFNKAYGDMDNYIPVQDDIEKHASFVDPFTAGATSGNEAAYTDFINNRLNYMDASEIDMISRAAEVVSNNRIIDELLTTDMDKWTEDNKKQFTDATSKRNEATTALATEYTSLSGYKEDLEIAGETDSEEYKRISQYLSLISPYIRTSNDQLDDMFNQNQFKDQRDELMTLASEDNLDGKIISTKFEDVNTWLDANNVSITDFITYLKDAKKESDKLAKDSGKPLSFSQTISELDKLNDKFSSMKSVYNNFKDKGSIDFSDISSLTEQFKDVNGANKYIKMMSNADGDINKTQEAFNGLTSCLIEQSGILETVDDNNKNLIISMLEEMGIANTSKVVDNAITKAKASRYIETQKVSDATKIETDKLMENAKSASIDETAYRSLLAQEILFNNNNLDNKQKCEEILEIASAAGVATIQMSDLNNEIAKISGKKLGSGARTEYFQGLGGTVVYENSRGAKGFGKGNLYIASDGTEFEDFDDASYYQNALNQSNLISSAFTTELNFTGGEKTEDALEKTKEESTETFNTIDTRLEKIKKTVNDIIDKVSDNNLHKTNLKYLKQAQDYIKSTSKEFDKAYNTYMKKFNKVDLKQEYKDMIINGDLDIQDGSNDNISKITKYLNSQVGYKEYGDNGNKYASIAGHENYEAWCDTFVKAALVEALGKDGALKAVGAGILGSAGTSTSSQGYKDRNQWYQTPKVGDQVFFSGKNGEGHTGLVTGVNGTKITFVEGNYGDKVSKNTVDYKTASGQRKVLGFGRPDYGDTNVNIKVKDGSGKILEFDSDSKTYKNLKEAKEYWDLAQDAEEGGKELDKLFQDSLEQEYDEINKFRDTKISVRESKIEANGITTRKDLNFLINQERKRSTGLTRVRKKMLKEGEIQKGSVAWKEKQADIDKSKNDEFEYLLQREELAADINTKTDIADLNFQLDLTNNAMAYDEAKGNYTNTKYLRDRIAINKYLIGENSENINTWEQERALIREKYSEDYENREDYLNLTEQINNAIKQNGEYNVAVLEDEKAIREVLIEQLNDQLSLLEATQSELKSINDLNQAMGKDLSANDYQKLIDNNLQQISNLQSSIHATWSSVGKEGGAKDMATAASQVSQLNAQINQLKTSNIELKKQMRDDVYWRDFERAHESVQNLQSVLESMVGFIDDDMMFVDGKITDFGISKLATLSHQFVQAKEEVSNYMADLENLEKLYTKGEYTEKEYKEKLQELKEGLLDAAQSVKGFSDSIVDMHQTLLQNELDELKETSESYIEALQKKKDYYDYDKTLRNANKNLQQLKAERDALEGIATAEAKAKKARLDAQIQEAEEELADTKYEHYISLITDGLNDTVENLQENYDEYFEKLSTDFDEIANIMLKAAELYESSASTIANSYNMLLASLGVNTSTYNWSELTGLTSDHIAEILKTNTPTTTITDFINDTKPDFSHLSASSDLGNVNIECRYDNLINVEGNVDKDILSELKQYSNEIYGMVKTNLTQDVMRHGGKSLLSLKK